MVLEDNNSGFYQRCPSGFCYGTSVVNLSQVIIKISNAR